MMFFCFRSCRVIYWHSATATKLWTYIYLYGFSEYESNMSWGQGLRNTTGNKSAVLLLSILFPNYHWNQWHELKDSFIHRVPPEPNHLMQVLYMLHRVAQRCLNTLWIHTLHQLCWLHSWTFVWPDTLVHPLALRKDQEILWPVFVCWRGFRFWSLVEIVSCSVLTYLPFFIVVKLGSTP